MSVGGEADETAAASYRAAVLREHPRHLVVVLAPKHPLVELYHDTVSCKVLWQLLLAEVLA